MAADRASYGPRPDPVPDAAPRAPGPESEQGPAGDDPTTNLLEDEPISVRDPDLVEPGLPEADLGLLELGEISDDEHGPLDEVGTSGGDEADAAAAELDEGGEFVVGSEPAELPGVTDDLFPSDEGATAIRDSGEEGFDEDLSDALDDAVNTGDAAWRQSGPPDEADDLGGDLAVPGRDGEGLPREPTRVTPWPDERPVRALALCGARVLAAFAAPGGVALEILHPEAERGALGPPLAFEDEEQRVVSAGCTETPASGTTGIRAVHVATDRGMVFRWVPGTDGWTVIDAYVPRDGGRTSWLPLGVSRSPFRLLALPAAPERLWAWRPGGPLLRADGDGSWSVEDAAPTLRAVAGDPVRGSLLALFAADETAIQWSLGPGGMRTERALPPDVADVLLAPGATAAARDGVLWVGCRDPELPVLRSDDDGRRWAPVPGVRSVRRLLVLPDGRLSAVVTSALEDSDELCVVSPDGGPRLLWGALEPSRGAGGPSPGDEPPRRLGELVAVPAGAVLWLKSGERLLRLELAGGSSGRAT